MKKTILIIAITAIIMACGTQKSAVSKRSKKAKLTLTEQKASLFQDVKYLIGREQYSSALSYLDSLINLSMVDSDFEERRYKGMILQVTGEKEAANSVYNTIIHAENASAIEKKRAQQLQHINNRPRIIKTEENLDTKVEQDSISSKDAFKVIEKTPVFPGCENVAREMQTKCMSQGVAKHIVKTIDVNIAQVTDMTGFIRSYVNYEIDTTGNISKIRTSGKNAFLNLEAHRVMAQLPQVIPGMQRGEKVAVSYSIPIRFATH